MTSRQDPAVKSLHQEIVRFQSWATTVEHRAEWEENYLWWDVLYHAVRNVIQRVPFQTWTDELQGQVLYTLARDNEDEQVLDELIDHPAALVRLAEAALAYPDMEARWQIAHGLGQIQEYPERCETLLHHFATLDQDEYVRRRALLALGNRRSPSAEPLALAAWDTAHEYQRIAAMAVLSEIQSTHLPSILEAASRDPRETVRGRAAWIQRQAAQE